MTRWFVEPFEAPYMQRALLVVLALAVTCGIVSTLVHLRREEFAADTLSHAIFPGIAVALFADVPLVVGAIVAAVLAVVALTVTRHADPDATLAVILSTFFAAGVVLVSRRASFQADLTQLLFGRLLTVGTAEVITAWAIAAVVVIGWWAWGHRIVAATFDPTVAHGRGWDPKVAEAISHAAIAIVVVAAARAVGTGLVVAMLVAPAAVARQLRSTVPGIIVAAIGVVAAIGAVTLAVSFRVSIDRDWRIATGAAIAVALCACYPLARFVRYVRTNGATT
jgi:manganese/iron transport system permease protein